MQEHELRQDVAQGLERVQSNLGRLINERLATAYLFIAGDMPLVEDPTQLKEFSYSIVGWDTQGQPAMILELLVEAINRLISRVAKDSPELAAFMWRQVGQTAMVQSLALLVKPKGYDA